MKNEKGEPRPAYCVLAYKTGKCTTPTVVTGPVNWLEPHACFEAPNTLELTGEINPNGVPTTYDFEYSEEQVEGGFTKEHPAKFKTTTEPAGSGTTPIKVNADVTVKDPILQCWVITYRLAAMTSAGPTYGESKHAEETE